MSRPYTIWHQCFCYCFKLVNIFCYQTSWRHLLTNNLSKPHFQAALLGRGTTFTDCCWRIVTSSPWWSLTIWGRMLSIYCSTRGYATWRRTWRHSLSMAAPCITRNYLPGPLVSLTHVIYWVGPLCHLQIWHLLSIVFCVCYEYYIYTGMGN